MKSKIPEIKQWALTPHAVERAFERGISVAEIGQILDNPTVALAQGPKWILAKAFAERKDNMLAAVVLERKDDLWVVITLMVNFETASHKHRTHSSS